MKTNDPPFVGPRLKVGRAQSHVRELGTIVGEYVARSPCQVVCHDGAEQERPERHLWKIHIHKSPPDLRTILGDVVHNLRAALDLLACDLVTLNGKEPNKVYFPIAQSADLLEARIRETKFNRASAEAVNLLKKLGPYPGGTRLFRAIHDLDIMDKHKRLVPIMYGAMLPNLSVSGNFYLGVQIELRDGQGVFDLPATAGNQIGQSFSIIPEFKFPKDSPFPRQSLTPTLQTLCAETDEVIAEFANLYGATLN